VVRCEHDERVGDPARRRERVEHAAEMDIELRNEAHVRGPHMARHGLLRKAQAFVVLAIRAHDRMLVGAAVLRSVQDRARVRIAEHCVIWRRRDIRPVRLHVRKVQNPRRVTLGADPVEREIRHVRGFGVLLGDARRQVHVAHLPSRRKGAAGIDSDHVLAPRIGARVAVRTQVGRVPRLGTWRRVTVVPVEHGESALAQERATLRFDFDPEARERLVVRQHMRLAGKRRRPSPCAQIVAEGVLRRG